MGDKNVKLNNAMVWYEKGNALGDSGKYLRAIKCYEKAITLNPKDADAWNNKGSALDNLKKHDDAIKAYDEAIRLNPKGLTQNKMNTFIL